MTLSVNTDGSKFRSNEASAPIWPPALKTCSVRVSVSMRNRSMALIEAKNAPGDTGLPASQGSDQPFISGDLQFAVDEGEDRLESAAQQETAPDTHGSSVGLAGNVVDHCIARQCSAPRSMPIFVPFLALYRLQRC